MILAAKTLLLAKHIALAHDHGTAIIPGSAIVMKVLVDLSQSLQNLSLVMLVFHLK
jgi:hypothetical protein